MYRLSLIFLILFTSNLVASDKLVDYISVGISKQSVNNKAFNSGSSLSVTTGKNNIYNSLGLEVEGNVQLSKPKATIGLITANMKFWSMGMYGTYLWTFDKITVKPRLGLVYENIKSTFNTSNTNPTKPIDKSKLGLSGGVGISYKITNNTNIYTNYTKFEDDIDHLTFGAEFKF